jgi:hypothetical protein
MGSGFGIPTSWRGPSFIGTAVREAAVPLFLSVSYEGIDRVDLTPMLPCPHGTGGIFTKPSPPYLAPA